MAKIAVDEGLILEFFLIFSRTECALKESGLFKRAGERLERCGWWRRLRAFFRRSPAATPPKLPDVMPDWDKFAVTLRSKFDVRRTLELRQACQLMIDAPPNRQVILDDAVAWETPIRGKGDKDIDFILRMVRCVRNNLFHGGDRGARFHESVQQLEARLRASVVILQECLSLSPDQEKAFREAAL